MSQLQLKIKNIASLLPFMCWWALGLLPDEVCCQTWGGQEEYWFVKLPCIASTWRFACCCQAWGNSGDTQDVTWNAQHILVSEKQINIYLPELEDAVQFFCGLILLAWTSNMVSQVIGLLKSFWSLFFFSLLLLLLVLSFIYFFHRASGLAHRHQD